MPQVTKDFAGVKFSRTTIHKARDAFLGRIGDVGSPSLLVSVTLDEAESWEHDNEDEFFNDYAGDVMNSSYRQLNTSAAADLMINFHRGRPPYSYSPPVSRVTVRLPQRAEVLAVLGIFQAAAEGDRVYKEPPRAPVIFIGHGHGSDWKDLRDHLRDRQKFDVEAFEGNTRAGFPAIEVVERMADRSTIALLVHTAEDELVDGRTLARSNVIHETGFFQGRLGHHQAVILREEGCAEYSNLAGVQEIRYAPGQIDSTFGEVVALVRRLIAAAQEGA